MTYNVAEIRNQFPILTQKVYKKPLIYLDNAATTQKPDVVIQSLETYYSKYNANIHRGVHFLSSHCTDATESARKTVQKFINAAHPHEIIFTRGTTEAINLVAKTFGQIELKKGDKVLVTRMEHHSNIVPWQMACEQYGAELCVVEIDKQGTIDLNSYEKALNENVKIAAFTHISNTLGTINDVKKMVEMAHSQDIPVLIDGAQAIQHTHVDVQDLDADFYVFSGHKVYAPTGIGVLYGKEKWLEKLPPWEGGGEMIDRVSFEKTTYNTLPFKFEAGTPNYIGAIALGVALDYIQNIGIDSIKAHEEELLRYATERISEINDLEIIGTAEHKSSVLSFIVKNIHPYDIGVLLDKTGIAVRTGNHCTQPLHDWYNISGTVRASFAMYNTKSEIDYFIEKLDFVLNMLQ
ncbi:MAG: cysteine desulfurase [Salinivirgaceae bacterium]|jgi:cysteine desulfurase/selenocysteine lyase|nr:cysteine desulfurase [Salinivirgaceae bacterium]